MEARYGLKTSFKYAGADGQIEDASFITMTAPNFKQMSKLTPIKQAFSSAIKESLSSFDSEALEVAQEATTETSGTDKGADSDDGMDASSILMIMHQWTGDLSKVFGKAADLFKSGAAMVDGETKLSGALLEKMSMDDFEGLFGTYLANFIVPSLTDGQ